MERYDKVCEEYGELCVYSDVVIVGAGIAGLYTALMLPDTMKISILSKGKYTETNSYLAQGGISSAENKQDRREMFFEDTMRSGRYESDRECVKVLVSEARKNIIELEKLGVEFDKDERGEYILAREGAHSLARILRRGDYTGKAIMDVLYHEIKNRKNITLNDSIFVMDLLMENNKCMGVLYKNKTKIVQAIAPYTVLATGGIGAIFSKTTNTECSTGDGIAMVARVGGNLRDMSYVQFHPTAFYNEQEDKKRSFLISEAVRGEGAYLYNEAGERFMKGVHPLEELAPRDVVSAAIQKEVLRQNKNYVYLDVTSYGRERLKGRFPTIYKHCLDNGIDMGKQWIPVAPCAHYFMGGIKVDLYGRTSIKKLYACGECSSTGVHGRNRLASNSLLEAIVFGNRVASDISKEYMEKTELYETNQYTVNYKQENFEDITVDELEERNKQVIFEEIKKHKAQENKIRGGGIENDFITAYR